jgi:hypothetical protein
MRLKVNWRCHWLAFSCNDRYGCKESAVLVNVWCLDKTHAGEQVLRAPAAATVVAAARGAGLDDLKAGDAPVHTAAKGKIPGRSARKQGAASGKGPATGKLAQAIAAAAAPEGETAAPAGGVPMPEADGGAEVQAAEAAQAEALRAWSAFTAVAAAVAAPAATAATGGDTAAGQGQYLHRLPALAQRLGSVLQGALYAEPAADTPLVEGATSILPPSAC